MAFDMIVVELGCGWVAALIICKFALFALMFVVI